VTVIFFHDPEFFPPLSFFHGLVNSDMWVVIDHTRYTSRSKHNRCRIKTETGGITLLAAAVKRPCNKPICQTVIDNNQPWKRYFLKVIANSYSQAPFYKDYVDDLTCLVLSPHVLLETLTVQSDLWVAELLGTSPKVACTKDYYPDLPRAEIEETFCRRLQATPFDKPFKHPHYQQLREPFEEGLSVLDALLCVGAKETRRLLDG